MNSIVSESFGSEIDYETQSLLSALQILCQILQLTDDPHTFERSAQSALSETPRKAVKLIARELGIKAVFKSDKTLDSDRLPLLARDTRGHWLLVAQKTDDAILIQRPEQPSPELLSEEEFGELWSGETLQLKSRATAGLLKKFDIRWFIPELLKYRKLGMEVLAASAILQLFALISPLFFQVVMDKVLVHNAVSTLDVLVTVLVAVALFEILLQTLRQYLATRTAARIDAKLGSNLYRHLVDLPLAYFKSRSVGVTVMRVNELNAIREFITSTANTLIIDLGFTLIFFAVMFLYSPLLTLIVIGAIPLYALVSFFITGPLQKRVEDLGRDSAVNNSFLTEALTGVETVKALALESQMARRWEYQTRDFVYSNFKVQQLSQLSNSLIQVISKVTMVLVLWIGARQVIGLELSIGQLIAFNMMANHVSQPIIRLTELWRNFVQARVSVERLGDVLNTLPEVNNEQAVLTNGLRGNVTLENVLFRYTPDSPVILNNISLNIPAGKMVAFVGKSGSGKSTITRLVQKLYTPERGRILLDEQDVAGIDPVSLRQSMSIVLQENFLFNRSVRDNIAIMKPSAPLEEVVTAAKKAGAHEFILELKDGYDTVLAEGGASLSGGQRQRIAIARSLITDPSVLIFDEATSALDDHSQAIIKENMRLIQQGRTVILIAHRLSTVKDCDCIFVLDKGQIVEAGNHNQLLARPDSAYRQLWQLQRAELNQDQSTPVATG
ncbi:type I secretion system permease/ATPase [Aliamphritea hakodatensis]|uniref:type I secretion system permease/ATPase n=1 Tax=Aliamphritea hakodatensis TaxID=2895352 RepID=UPI0022FD8CE1|nr:type I secretion system permease/ATPase [Aliamphritea hakodatensis]